MQRNFALVPHPPCPTRTTFDLHIKIPRTTTKPPPDRTCSFALIKSFYLGLHAGFSEILRRCIVQRNTPSVLNHFILLQCISFAGAHFTSTSISPCVSVVFAWKEEKKKKKKETGRSDRKTI